MHRSKRKRNVIIFSLVGVLLCMVVGYAAFQTQLKVTGTSKVTSNWDIEITNVTDGTPTGSAENAVAPDWDKLTASMEANLYDKGDAMEYDVTIENKGTIDAKLNDILTNLENSNSEAVLITFSGYTKGEVLKAKENKIVHVKIEYNPDYGGEETSSEVTIDFEYTQDNKSEDIPKTYLITYDCVTNGGNDCSTNNEYLMSGSNVDLTKTGTKNNYNFIGWNTDKDAEEGLTELIVQESNITLYAIYKPKDTTPPIIDDISTTTTSSTITVIVTAHDDESKIVKYEYSKDGGKTWISNGSDNSYTFTGLNPNTTYNIKVKVTNENDLTAEKEAITSIDITDNVTDNGDGLYEDEYEEGRYVYKGTDPNNYIEFNGELWRIVSKESDGTYKIVRNDILNEQPWSAGNNTWANASLKTYLNGDYYDSLTKEAQGYIQNSKWTVGPVTMNNDDLAAQIASEKGSTVEGNVGLLTHSDYLRANTNKAQCGTDKVNFSNYRTCKNTDWLYTSSNAWWTVSPSSANTNTSWQITAAGDINAYSVTNNRGVRPSVYLKSSITLSGQGTKSNPYKISSGVTTGALDKPTFTEEETDSGKDVTIHYPSGCGSTLTCTYQKDNGQEIEVNQKEVVVSFDKSGSLIATVSDGENKVSNSYTVTITSGVEIGGIEVPSESENGGIYTDDHNNIRYYGSDPNNYVSFNNELWRIMGVIDGKIKIIRNESIGTMQWDSNNTNNWNNSSLKSYLNVDYYSVINNTYRNMISSETFHLGGATSSNYTTLTANGYYNAERDSTQVYSGNPASTTQNIGLMYPSDYGYASGSSCLSTPLYNFGDSCKNSNYLFSGVRTFEWLQAPFANGSVTVALLYTSGNVYGDGTSSSNFNAVRPVTYLKTTVQITGGDGTQSNPFTIADSVAEENISLNISTTSTTNSITVVASADADSGIAKYEYSNNGGNSWTTSYYNTYTFTGLTKNTSYSIKVRVTSVNGKQIEKSTSIYTKNINVPTFNESETSSGKNVTITYPSGCGNSLTCTYQKDNESIQYVYSTTAVVGFTESGSVVARVSDGTNSVSSSYAVTIDKATINIGGQNITLVNSGDGLYEDEYEPGRYVYKGKSPQNYIKLDNDELWRIISKESDGTYKIVKDGKISEGYMKWNNSNNTDWTTASLNTYLNGTYYQTLDSTLKTAIVSHSWDIGAVSLNNDDLKSQINEEKTTTWIGKIGLFSVSDYIRASNNKINCGSYYLYNTHTTLCQTTNWLDMTASFWTISASTDLVKIHYIWQPLSDASRISTTYAVNQGVYVVPCAYLKADVKLEGQGYLGDEYQIVN